MADQERAWYQNGWIVLGILVLAGIFGPGLYKEWKDSQKIRIRPQIAGKIDQPLLGQPTFTVFVWHQHDGNLRNGTFMVAVEGAMIPDGKTQELHSFEVWEPNEDNAFKYVFPLKYYDPNEKIHVAFLANGKEIATYYNVGDWSRGNWECNRENPTGTVAGDQRPDPPG